MDGHAETITPRHILEIGFAFRKSKALLSAAELGLFTALGDGPLDHDALVQRLKLHGRGARDFFDALVALGLLDRDAQGRYFNTPECALYLDRRKPTYLGGLFDYLNTRMYQTWDLLTEALRSGAPQGGLAAAGDFESFYADEPTADIFLKGMTGGSLLTAKAIARTFPWHRYGTFIDIGTAQGCVPVEIAQAHAHLRGGGFDLLSLTPTFIRYVRARGLEERLTFHAGDFFDDPLPTADVLIMGRVLHDWDVETRKLLLRKCYAALPAGGALIVYDTMIDDTGRQRPHSLLASLNMLIQTAGGSEYTAGECMGWMVEAGFAEAHMMPLTDLQTGVVAIKADGSGPLET
jgi:O-methyltransferase domain/Dimerisation domain